jgi:cation-transporting ATPase 13A1
MLVYKLLFLQELHPNGAFVLVPCPVDKPLSSYACALGLRTTKGRGNSPSQVEQLLALWGSNVLDVPIPSFFTMLRAQMLSPLVMFQVFCSALWLLDEYWSITLWTLFMMLIFEGSTVFQRSRTRAMLSGMAPQPKPVYVLRDNAWVLLTSKDLLPGDIISVTQSSAPATQPAPAAGTPSPSPTPAAATNATVPCDCLLLRGSAVVNEASLTGESVPQMKVCHQFCFGRHNLSSHHDLNLLYRRLLIARLLSALIIST